MNADLPDIVQWRVPPPEGPIATRATERSGMASWYRVGLRGGSTLQTAAPISAAFQGSSWISGPLARARFLLQIQRPLDFRTTLSASALLLYEIAPLPDPGEVERADPSESVRSADILAAWPVLQYRRFEPMQRNAFAILLSGIAGNFSEDDAASMTVLRMLFAIEDALIVAGALESDFVVVMARPKRV